MHPLLSSIFEHKQFKNSNGEIIPIHSETSEDQCRFIQKILADNHFKDSLEVGFAYGMSTLTIVEEIAKRDGRHVVIDKFQISDWGGNGLDLVKQAGYADRLEFKERYCYEVLPELLASGKKFDFAYVDSTKEFDWLLVDFFYIDKLLRVGGIMVFDDVSFPSIRKLLRYLSRFPNYKVHSQFPENARQSTVKRFSSYLRALPFSRKLLKSDLQITDYELGINSNCIALQKTGDDKRNWDWHVDF